jgi:trimethylguanosine synthase
MGSLGLPVSFSTNKVVSAHNYEQFSSWLICNLILHRLQKTKTSNKGKKKDIQAPFEEANTGINNDVRICVNTEDRESDVLSMTILEHSSSCYGERCCDDTDKMLKEGSLYVDEQEEYGCATIFSVEKATSCVAANKLELGILPNNTGNPVKPESPIQEIQASDLVLQCSEEMLGRGESRCSSDRIYEEERNSTREDQISMEDLSVSHNDYDTDCVACPSSAEPLSVDGHAFTSESNFYYDYGDWRVIWDPFYSRYYFYNIQTQESTWRPPEGLEDFGSYLITDATKELAELGSQSTSTAMQENCKNQTLNN